MMEELTPYRASLPGTHYGKLLLEKLPNDGSIGRIEVNLGGEERALVITFRRCWRHNYNGWDGLTLESRREMTGGAVMTARVSGYARFTPSEETIYLKVGWGEKAAIRAASRLYDWGRREWQRQQVLKALDKEAEGLLGCDKFGRAVEEQEKVWGVSDYGTMTTEDACRWLEWLKDWKTQQGVAL